MRIVDNDNALQIGFSKHIKLSKKDIEDIQRLYENGHSIPDIHKMYPNVTYSAVYYWVGSHRELSLNNRKKYPDNRITRTITEEEKQDINNRRKMSGLKVVEKKGYACYKTTPDDQKRITDLYSSGYSINKIADMLKLKRTSVQSVLQSKKHREQYAHAKQDRKDNRQQKVDYIMSHLELSKRELARHTGLSVTTVDSIINNN